MGRSHLFLPLGTHSQELEAERPKSQTYLNNGSTYKWYCKITELRKVRVDPGVVNTLIYQKILPEGTTKATRGLYPSTWTFFKKMSRGQSSIGPIFKKAAAVWAHTDSSRRVAGDGGRDRPSPPGAPVPAAGTTATMTVAAEAGVHWQGPPRQVRTE